MSYTNSSLASHTNLSPNCNVRTEKIDTFTPHVVVGHMSMKNLGILFSRSTTQASSNYGIDDDGNIAMFVEEKNRSWCSSSSANDQRAITVEIASDAKDPYAITNGAMDGLIKLGADVCKRNGIPKLLWKADKKLIGKVAQQNITVHRWFYAKACPGNYLYGRLGEVATEVNKLLIPKPIVTPPKATTGLPYKVRVNTEVLHCRRGPGTNNPVIAQIHQGEVYTITSEAYGLGSSKWGQLKSGSGWIALDYCTKVW